MAENTDFIVKVTINSSETLFNSAKIQKFRKLHNLKRTELSQMTGIPVNSLQMWELGHSTPHYKYWRKLYLFMREYGDDFKLSM